MNVNFRLLSGLLLAVIIVLTGCSQSTSTNDQESSDEPVTFTLFSADPHTQWDNMESPVNQKIVEATGVTLEGEFDVNGGDQKISLMAASGDYPDLIWPKGNSNILVDAGALIDLTDLIEEHAPNLKKIYGDYFDRLKWSTEDPSIYILPTAEVDHTYWEPGHGFMLQHDVVKELGYPDIRTVYDFEQAIREYKEKYPEIDGQPTIGLSLLADDWRILISTTNPALYVTGVSDDGEYYIDPDTYEATLHYRRPEEKDYFRWLNHMNDSGLLDPESFVQSYDQYLAKISSGRVLAAIDANWHVGEAQRALREEGKHERMFGMYPATLSEEYKHPNFQSSGYLGGWGIGITVDCEDPVRAIKFLDFLASEEGQILQNWGIEGEHYEVIDGERVIPEEEMDRRNNSANYVRDTGIGVLKGFAPSYGDGMTDSTGQTYTIVSPDQIIEAYTDVEKEVLANYGVEMWKDLYPAKEEFPVKPWGAGWNITVESGSQLELINQRCRDIMKKRVPEAILASPEDFDDIWDAFMNDLEQAGVEEAEKAFTELVQERVELWN
ncbi:ABC transporter substrate-binding protein [Halalkalibacterium halodurans]|uniref:ABC transporter substrate-binding protein n=1 Tax=Halalkalibacterium halodurans TaxID=86665 RepID=UPI002AAA5BF4|nr:ABC transporter substrate-binding protein [Halalkalibacterium halodurans]MDY7222475.1 ABC transporter substrate-binding protein [Halalkalibacterium halodurans]MDY7241696.1 ABC transporter substrate-binding protein [Halalkalibacterium halodurans]